MTRQERWERWVGQVEKALGHSLDGDQGRDGYSLDSALEEFELGLSPEQYVASVEWLKSKMADEDILLSLLR